MEFGRILRSHDEGVSGLCVPKCSRNNPGDCASSAVCASRDGVSQCVPADAVTFSSNSVRTGVASRLSTREEWDLSSGPDHEGVFFLTEQEACSIRPAYDMTVASFSSACRLPILAGDNVDIVLDEPDDLDAADFVIGYRVSIDGSDTLRQLLAEVIIRCTDRGTRRHIP